MLDEATFSRFYRATASALRNYAARTLGSSMHADDVVQEAFLRLLRHPPQAAADEELRAYVFRIASNLIRDGWRRRRHDAPPSTSEECVTIDEALPLDVQRTFSQLRLLDRQLLWLAHVEGADHRHIAAVLGLREGSVRVLLSRARKRLSALLDVDTNCTARAVSPKPKSTGETLTLMIAVADDSIP